MEHATIVYVGDFDFRNQNVQSFLVINNAKILQAIGYKVAFVGINTRVKSLHGIDSLNRIPIEESISYFELPNTLNFSGLFKMPVIAEKIIKYLEEIDSSEKIEYLISYQSPSYSILLKKIIKWCRVRHVKYIVNCADLPTFDIHPIPRRYIMAANWSYLHKINKREADGVIAVSSYIQEFYKRSDRPSIIIPPLFDETTIIHQEQERYDVVSFVYAGIPFKVNGRIASEKGMKDRLDKVIDLFLILSELNVPYIFKIIGIDKKDYLTGVPRHVEALEKCPEIDFLGRLNHKETLEMVAQADFSINYRDDNLMTRAGFSTKIVESISLGTPVVINSISDTFDYVHEGDMGFKLLEDNNANVDLLRKLCSMPAKIRGTYKKICRNSKVFQFENYEHAMNSFLESI